MATPRYRPRVADVLQMDIADIESITDISKMRALVRTLADAGNKRLKRLESYQGDYSPAFDVIMGSGHHPSGRAAGGKFKTANMDLVQLKNEFKRARSFLNAKTSTVTGLKKSIDQLQKKIKDQYNVELDLEDIGKVWRTMNEIRKTEKGKKLTKEEYYKYMSAVQEVLENHPDYTPGEAAGDIMRRFDQIYMGYKEQELGVPNEGDFTDIPGL